jgi:hypothetical protein
MRSIHSEYRETLPGSGEDVRDCRVWVTTDGGFEVWWPISELIPELQAGTFVIEDKEE